jgi:hypothetical protein
LNVYTSHSIDDKWLNIECIYITFHRWHVVKHWMYIHHIVLICRLYLSLSTPDKHVHLVSPQLYILIWKEHTTIKTTGRRACLLAYVFMSTVSTNSRQTAVVAWTITGHIWFDEQIVNVKKVYTHEYIGMIIVDILSSSANNVLILSAWRYLLVLTNDVTNWKLLRNCVWIELI